MHVHKDMMYRYVAPVAESRDSSRTEISPSLYEVKLVYLLEEPLSIPPSNKAMAAGRKKKI